MESWVITATPGAIGTMVAIAEPLGTVTVVAVGARELAESCTNSGADKVLWLPVPEDVPAEAYATCLAEQVRQARPALIMSSENAQDRVLTAAAAAAVGAKWLSGIRAVTADGDGLTVTASGLENRVIAQWATDGPVAALYSGRDEGLTSDRSVAIDEITGCVPDAGLRLVERVAAASAGGLDSAARVVGVGRGVKARNDLPMIDELAQVMDASVACTLPVSDDLHWFEADHVVGRTGQAIKPDLYLALGLSGQPQHQDGIRDAKVVAAINSDPKAPIFRRAQFGIVGDLYEVLPDLLVALKNN